VEQTAEKLPLRELGESESISFQNATTNETKVYVWREKQIGTGQ
jgi:hypothetical protein